MQGLCTKPRQQQQGTHVPHVQQSISCSRHNPMASASSSTACDAAIQHRSVTNDTHMRLPFCLCR